MNVIRTFHPVGQGAFYTERFYREDQPQAVHNIVYDCGVAWGYIGKVKHVVTQAFNKDDTIDYLFISHLDYDHISLIKTLLSSVQKVKNIVLPLVSIEQLEIIVTYYRLSGHDHIVRFLSSIINHLSGDGEDYFGGDYTVYFVGDSNEGNINIGNARILENGKEQETDWEPEWVLIPYNVQYNFHKQQFITQLNAQLAKPKFNAEIQKIGETPFIKGNDLYDRLKDSALIEKVLENNYLKNAIKEAYKRTPGGINKNSLLLYSGPARPEFDYVVLSCFAGCRHNCYRCVYSSAGCLYTGDSTFDKLDFENKFKKVWGCIGTIQLPHHGSVDSFDVTKASIDRPYIFPVSCGYNNSYGHPSGKVLAYLLNQNCYIRIVTEMANSVYMQRIERVP